MDIKSIIGLFILCFGLACLNIFLRRRHKKIMSENNYWVKAAGRNIKWGGVFFLICTSLVIYCFTHFINASRIRAGEPPESYFPVLLISSLPYIIFIILGEYVKRKKLWAYRITLYGSCVLFLVLLVARLKDLDYFPIFYYPLLPLSLYSLYCLAQPKVKEQFSAKG